MAEETEIQKLKNKYPEFFSQFSPEFLEFVFSEETSLEIASICLENKIEDEEVIGKISYQVALALFNQISGKSLAKIFEKEVGLNHEIVEKVSVAVEERIFSQISEIQPKKSSLTESETILPSEARLGTKQKREKKDTYLEPIE